MKKQINVVIAGGSGFWSEKTHYPSIISLRRSGINARVVAVIDPVDPNTLVGRPNTRAVMRSDSPLRIDPSGLDYEGLKDCLDELNSAIGADVLIIATNPVYHLFYTQWGVKNRINTLCDKPLVVAPNSSFDVRNAKSIWIKYNQLKREIIKAKMKDPSFMVSCPLRRRAMTPFLKIAEGISNVRKATGEGIRYMNMTVNGGLHKYPAEFMKGGAHGYLDGIGSLSHSSYHYIDIIAWYLSIGIDDNYEIEVSMPYLYRVKDYLKTRSYKALMKLVEGNTDMDKRVKLPRAVLNSELDFAFQLKLKDPEGNFNGIVNYTCNHTTFAPRREKFDRRVTEYANEKRGGRMSHIYLDIHQGAMQNFQLLKNDVVFFGNKMIMNRRLHPTLGKDEMYKVVENAYDSNTITPENMICNFIKHAGGVKSDKRCIDLISNYDSQVLTNRLFSKFYEMIAEASAEGSEGREGVETRIKLKEMVIKNE